MLLDEHIKRNWLTEQIPLQEVDTSAGQILSLFTGLHAFRHNHLVQPVGQIYEVFDDVARHAFLADEVYKGAINLEEINVEGL